LHLLVFAAVIPRVRRSTRFPYTTLFRSEGVSQVFLVESWVAGLIILAGLAVNSWWTAAAAAVGAVSGTLLAIWFGVSAGTVEAGDRKSTRLNSSHVKISYAVFCLKKKKI